jgi:mRNA-degrading endonuclease RelE of RelBE toxin-antitoxin system
LHKCGMESMLNDTPLVQIDLSPEYKQNLRSLVKRYRNIRSDTQDVLTQIQSGNFVGDRIAGLGEDYIVIKVRVKNSNIQKGKSAGYRLVYQVESPVSVLLLTIYSKSDRDDISPNEIFNILSSIRDPEQGA